MAGTKTKGVRSKFLRLFFRYKLTPCWKKNCKVPDHLYCKNKVGYNKTLN